MSDVAWGALGVNLVVTAGVVVLLMAVTFAYAMRTGVHAIMDTVWALGFVVIAAVSFTLSSGHGDTTRRALVLVLVAVWGLRLGGYIFGRNRGHGEDPRYAALLRHNKGSLARFVAHHIYLAQGRVMWLVSLPVQVAMYERARPGPVTWIGVAVVAGGLSCEAVGDLQLSRFRADPANRGRILERGLWAWTRHPNYFGDACVWWGLWLLACSSWIGLATVVAPTVMTWMLVRRTGKALLEKTMRRSRGAAYDSYVARTSGFFPRPPRRLPVLEPGDRTPT
jgi:steroid 5-alpha reductase family enzyme